MSQTRQATALTAGITTQGDLMVLLTALNAASETLIRDDGATFDIPRPAEAASLLVAGVRSACH